MMLALRDEEMRAYDGGNADVVKDIARAMMMLR